MQEILSDTEVLLGIGALGWSLVYILPKPAVQGVESVSEAHMNMGTVSRVSSMLGLSYMAVLENTSAAVHCTERSVSGKIQTPEELQQKPNFLQTGFQGGAYG